MGVLNNGNDQVTSGGGAVVASSLELLKDLKLPRVESNTETFPIDKDNDFLDNFFGIQIDATDRNVYYSLRTNDNSICKIDWDMTKPMEYKLTRLVKVPDELITGPIKTDNLSFIVIGDYVYITSTKTVAPVAFQFAKLSIKDGTYEMLTNMPTERQDLRPVYVPNQNKIYYIGGRTAAGGTAGVSAVNEAYDLTENKWVTNAPMTAAKAEVGLVYSPSDNSIYAIGGVDSAKTSLTTTYAYNVATNVWSTKTVVTKSSSYNLVYELDGKIYTVYGFSYTSGSGGSVSAMYVYNVAGNAWTTVTNMFLMDYTLTSGISAGDVKMVYNSGNTYNYMAFTSTGPVFISLDSVVAKAETISARRSYNLDDNLKPTSAVEYNGDFYYIQPSHSYQLFGKNLMKYDSSKKRNELFTTIPTSFGGLADPIFCVLNDYLYISNASSATLTAGLYKNSLTVKGFYRINMKTGEGEDFSSLIPTPVGMAGTMLGYDKYIYIFAASSCYIFDTELNTFIKTVSLGVTSAISATNTLIAQNNGSFYIFTSKEIFLFNPITFTSTKLLTTTNSFTYGFNLSNCGFIYLFQNGNIVDIFDTSTNTLMDRDKVVKTDIIPTAVSGRTFPTKEGYAYFPDGTSTLRKFMLSNPGPAYKFDRNGAFNILSGNFAILDEDKYVVAMQYTTPTQPSVINAIKDWSILPISNRLVIIG